MDIRILTEKDVSAWKKIRLEALQDSPESFGSSYEEEVHQTLEEWKKGLKKSDIFGAFLGNELVACIGFYRLTYLKTKHRGVIWGMYSNPEFRGRNIASNLLGTIILHAKSTGVLQLHLTCVTGNLDAIKLYQKFGFKIYGTEAQALKIGDDFFDEHLMMLNLHAHS